MVTDNPGASSEREREVRDGDRDLAADVERLAQLLDGIVAARGGESALALIASLRADAIALRAGTLPGGRPAFAARMAGLDLPALESCAHTFTQYFHLVNVAEEQHRIRVLRRRDRPGAAPPQSMGAACAELRASGVGPEAVRALLGRLFIMPVLTAHPTEARRRSVLDHLADLSTAIDGLDDPRAGASERARLAEELREAALALYCTDHARTTRPTPLDEVRAGLDVFDRTLLDATLLVYRNLEDALAAAWPGESFEVPPFLRFGTWIGGDRDGNPNVTAEVTRVALERARRLAVDRHLRDVDALGRELSLSARRVPPSEALVASLKEDRARLPEVAARAHRYVGEPWREKLWYVRARLRAAPRADRAARAAAVVDGRGGARSAADRALHDDQRDRGGVADGWVGGGATPPASVAVRTGARARRSGAATCAVRRRRSRATRGSCRNLARQIVGTGGTAGTGLAARLAPTLLRATAPRKLERELARCTGVHDGLDFAALCRKAKRVADGNHNVV